MPPTNPIISGAAGSGPIWLAVPPFYVSAETHQRMAREVMMLRTYETQLNTYDTWYQQALSRGVSPTHPKAIAARNAIDLARGKLLECDQTARAAATRAVQAGLLVETGGTYDLAGDLGSAGNVLAVALVVALVIAAFCVLGPWAALFVALVALIGVAATAIDELGQLSTSSGPGGQAVMFSGSLIALAAAGVGLFMFLKKRRGGAA